MWIKLMLHHSSRYTSFPKMLTSRDDFSLMLPSSLCVSILEDDRITTRRFMFKRHGILGRKLALSLKSSPPRNCLKQQNRLDNIDLSPILLSRSYSRRSRELERCWW